MRLFVWILLLSGFVRSEVLTTYGLVYAQGDVRLPVVGTKDLTLDLYRSSDETNGCALVLIHGGSFISGSSLSPDMVDAAQYFAERGWTCVSINYRKLGDDPPAPPLLEALGQPQLNAAHAAAVDTKRAIRWLRSHATAYGIDTNRIAALGHSAGAYCALMSAVTDREDFPNDTGVGDPDVLPGHSGKVNACTEVSGSAGFSLAEITPDDPPLLIWHGTADTTVDYSAATDIQSACSSNAVPHWLKPLPGIDHGAATWLATVDGRDVKSWSEDLYNRFFKLEVGGNAQGLSWPSVRDARYRLRSASNLSNGFTNHTGMVTSMSEVVELDWPGDVPFVGVDVLSGQP